MIGLSPTRPGSLKARPLVLQIAEAQTRSEEVGNRAATATSRAHLQAPQMRPAVSRASMPTVSWWRASMAPDIADATAAEGVAATPSTAALDALAAAFC